MSINEATDVETKADIIKRMRHFDESYGPLATVHKGSL